MIIDKKFWIDENSTPPTNYIWLKEGKAWEYNKNLNKWKVLDTLNAENFIQVFNSSTEEEKNAIKEALGISGGEGQSSQDSDVVHYSDYCLLTVDPDKPTVNSPNGDLSFYPNATADKILPLVMSGNTFIINDGERVFLSNPSYDSSIGLSTSDKNSAYNISVITSDMVESGRVENEMPPELGITGPGYLFMIVGDGPSM